MKKIIIMIVSLLAAWPAWALDARYTVVTVDPAKEQLALFHRDEAGDPFKRFDKLADWLAARGQTLRFAMNAGMYHADFSPVGLFVADGKVVTPLNLADGGGNFFLKPNGVFLLGPAGPQVVATSEYPALAQGVRLATQSGPLLLRRGVIHPAFNPASVSRNIRNGVGVAAGKVLFVISEDPVTFHEFASYFRDVLKCQDALYLDGAISGIYSPALGRNDRRYEFGPILGVVDSK